MSRTKLCLSILAAMACSGSLISSPVEAVQRAGSITYKTEKLDLGKLTPSDFGDHTLHE